MAHLLNRFLAPQLSVRVSVIVAITVGQAMKNSELYDHYYNNVFLSSYVTTFICASWMSLSFFGLSILAHCSSLEDMSDAAASIARSSL
jgi:uncharacterized membrane protein AbrB (regulator of aidB expression)